MIDDDLGIARDRVDRILAELAERRRERVDRAVELLDKIRRWTWLRRFLGIPYNIEPKGRPVHPDLEREIELRYFGEMNFN